jgi:hypothetical protein
MASASDSRIAAHPQTNRMILFSKDQDFGNVLDYPPDQYFGIAVVDPPVHGGRSVVLSLVEQLLLQSDVVAYLPGRLAVIQAGRIRLRPPP